MARTNFRGENVFGIAQIFPSGDRDEPNRKYPDGGTMKPLFPMPALFIGPQDPKLNLGVELSQPGVSQDVETVSSDLTVV